MEKLTKPEDLYIGRKRGLTAFAAAMFAVFGLFIGIAGPIALLKFPPEDDSVLTILLVAFPLIALYLLAAAVLNIRNLFFPYILTSDEKGVYVYAGLFHYGFSRWEDISAFSNSSSLLDFLDNEAPCIRMSIRNKYGLSFGKKWLLFWSYGSVKIHTLCSQIGRKELAGLLQNALAYYGTNDELKVKDEREEDR